MHWLAQDDLNWRALYCIIAVLADRTRVLQRVHPKSNRRQLVDRKVRVTCLPCAAQPQQMSLPLWPYCTEGCISSRCVLEMKMGPLARPTSQRYAEHDDMFRIYNGNVRLPSRESVHPTYPCAVSPRKEKISASRRQSRIRDSSERSPLAAISWAWRSTSCARSHCPND